MYKLIFVQICITTIHYTFLKLSFAPLSVILDGFVLVIYFSVFAHIFGFIGHLEAEGKLNTNYEPHSAYSN